MSNFETFMSGLPAMVPDPSQAISFSAECTEGKPIRVVKQRRLRTEIYAVARGLVSEVGLDNVQVQDLADRSGISVQTLYNIVGGRSEIICGAASEWVVVLAKRAEAVALQENINPIFAMVSMFWAASLTAREYTSGLVCSNTIAKVVDDKCSRSIEPLILFHLRGLQRDGSLLTRVDPPILARRVARLADSCIREWVAHPYDERSFRVALVDSCAFMLRGVVVGQELDRLDRALA